MDTKLIKVLLIEDNPGDARLIREMIAEAGRANFKVEWVDRLTQGLERLASGDINIVLTDLGLPDSQGLNTLIRIQEQAADLPVVVLTREEALGVEAIARGAQDYLVKGHVDSNLLVRAIRYAMERQQMLADLQQSNAELATGRAFLAGILDSTVDAILTVDEHGVIQSANKATVDLFGYDEDELIGKGIDTLVKDTICSGEIEEIHNMWGGGGGLNKR